MYDSVNNPLMLTVAKSSMTILIGEVFEGGTMPTTLP